MWTLLKTHTPMPLLPHSIRRLIPPERLFGLLLGLAVGLQLIIITYNHLSGFLVLEGIGAFLTRLLMGSVLSLLAIMLIALPDLYIIRYLDKSFHWNRQPFLRLGLQLMLTILFSTLVAILVTYISHRIGPYPEGLTVATRTNVLIFAVCNILLMILLEAWVFYMEGTQSRQKAQELERELSQVRFEVLKQQMNPHFMFNSLNVLSGLIGRDTEQAHRFIDEFSSIYRYVVDTIEQPVVSLKKELDFARSYLHLQQTRYGEHLQYSIDLPEALLDTYLPPLSLQLVLENACKHNLVSPEQPLQIDIFQQGGKLVVRNNLQPKISSGVSKGLGQKNLLKRYELVSKEAPEFRTEARHYTVLLPLIKE
jgi:sensor histidine kinase YesM